MKIDSMKVIPQPLHVSLLLLDTLDGERILIIHRESGDVVANFPIKDGNNFRFLPLKYSDSSDLSVIMYDTDNQFAAAIFDNVQCTIVDQTTFDPSKIQVPETP